MSQPGLSYSLLMCWQLFTEIDEVFDAPGEYITRGSRFHDETLRLLSEEKGRATLSNAQALTILSLE